MSVLFRLYVARHWSQAKLCDVQALIERHVNIFHPTINVVQLHVGVLLNMKSRSKVILANWKAVQSVCQGTRIYPANTIYDYDYAKAATNLIAL